LLCNLAYLLCSPGAGSLFLRRHRKTENSLMHIEFFTHTRRARRTRKPGTVITTCMQPPTIPSIPGTGKPPPDVLCFVFYVAILPTSRPVLLSVLCLAKLFNPHWHGLMHSGQPLGAPQPPGTPSNPTTLHYHGLRHRQPQKTQMQLAQLVKGNSI